MSDEGGLEEVRESFLSWALSSAISLSLASMMQNLTFFRQGTEEQLGNEMKKAVNGYLYFGAQWHGFWTSCVRFAVMITHPHATLGSGGWSDLTGQARPARDSKRGLRCKSIRCPLTNFLAQGALKFLIMLDFVAAFFLVRQM